MIPASLRLQGWRTVADRFASRKTDVFRSAAIQFQTHPKDRSEGRKQKAEVRVPRVQLKPPALDLLPSAFCLLICLLPWQNAACVPRSARNERPSPLALEPADQLAERADDLVLLHVRLLEGEVDGERQRLVLHLPDEMLRPACLLRLGLDRSLLPDLVARELAGGVASHDARHGF